MDDMTFKIPENSLKPNETVKVRDLTDDEWAAVAEFGLGRKVYSGTGFVWKGFTPAQFLVALHLMRSGAGVDETHAQMLSWCSALAALEIRFGRLAPQRLEAAGIDPDSTKTLRGLWLALFQYLLEMGFDEAEAASFAEGSRSFFENPVEPNYIHAREILRKFDKPRSAGSIRAYLSVLFLAHQREGGNISRDRCTVTLGPVIPKRPPTSTAQ